MRVVPTAEIDHLASLPDPPPPVLKSTPHLALPASAQNPFDLNKAVKDVSGTYQLDPDLATSVIRAESGFDVHAVSPKGAQG
ncbi:MAG: transglycosylase SLT domain-containing protein [Candidatus Sulfotelmatobacter sp.]